MRNFRFILPLTLALGMLGGLPVASYANCPGAIPQSLSPTDGPDDGDHPMINDPVNINDNASSNCPTGDYPAGTAPHQDREHRTESHSETTRQR